MKTLKDLICEMSGIYESNMDSSLKNELMSKIGSSFLMIADDDLYNRITSLCEEVPSSDKKGSLWKYVLPDTSTGASFKPIMVSLKNGTYRLPNDKEAYGGTASAMDKRLKNLDNLYKKNKLNYGLVTETNYHGFIYLLLNFKQVSPKSGDGWITVNVGNVGDKNFGLVSYNYSSKEWFYGANSSVRSVYVTKNKQASTMSKDYVEASRCIIDALLNKDNKISPHAFDCINRFFIHADKSKFNDKDKAWQKFEVEYNGKITNYLYMNLQTLQVLYATDFGGFQQQAANKVSIKDELDKIKNQEFATISSELNEYIHKNFTKVDNNSVIGRNWVQVREKGADYKYGRYMVSVETKEYRNQTFSEFYGSGIVD